MVGCCKGGSFTLGATLSCYKIYAFYDYITYSTVVEFSGMGDKIRTHLRD